MENTAPSGPSDPLSLKLHVQPLLIKVYMDGCCTQEVYKANVKEGL